MPGAIRPAGKYLIEGSTVKLKMVLRRDGKTLATFPWKAPGTIWKN